MNEYLLSICYVPDTASHFIPTISFNLPNSTICHYYPHLTDEKLKLSKVRD